MKSVCIKNLGCKVNAYECEFIISILLSHGYIIVDDNADIYIVNTCTVTNESDKKSRKIIHNLRHNNKNSIIVAMGCYIQNLVNKNETNEIINYVDILIGNSNKSKIIDYLDEFSKTHQKIIDGKLVKNLKFEDMEIEKTYNHTRGFIKVQDGCDNFCSYCIIPFVRGNLRSKDPEKIIKEAKTLVRNDCKEIILTGIHTGKYGVDLGSYDLFNLLLELIEIKDLYRIRLSSIEIVELNDRIISILSNEKIASHLHIPLQSGSDKILKLMNRRYNKEYFYEKIKKIRSINPLISISTDLIVGFPNETEEDFLETCNFLKEIGFSKIHVFPYSDREGTEASKMSNKVPSEEKKKRVLRILELSDQLKNNYEKKFIDKTLEVLIESKSDGYYYGHTSNNIYLKLKGNFKLNQVYKVNILNTSLNNDIIIL